MIAVEHQTNLVVGHLRARRKTIGLNRNEAARLSGIKPHALAQFETCCRPLSSCDFIRLGRALWPFDFDRLWSRLPVGGDLMDAAMLHVMSLPVADGLEEDCSAAHGFDRLFAALAIKEDGVCCGGSKAFLTVTKLLNSLTPREALVVRWRFDPFASFARPLTLCEVAIRLDITRERVRQIEARTVRKMRSAYRRLQKREEVAPQGLVLL